MRTLTVHPAANLRGEIAIPGDKSMSHRALMFASLAQGTSEIDGLLEGHDCLATLGVMRALGVHIELTNNRWLIHGQGRFALNEPTSILDCKNSGTTMRLMAGLLSALPFMSILDGTDQIKQRPMDRIIKPLKKMNAQIFGRHENSLAPLVTLPSKLKGIEHDLIIKSAQVKSALILAGLYAEGETRILNSHATRDHSEKILVHMGADIQKQGDALVIKPLDHELKPLSLSIPGDMSSAAFLLVAGVLLAESGITLLGVGTNITRTGLLDALISMGAQTKISNERLVANEPVADIFIKKSRLKAQSFSGDHIVRMIDEIPILALAATQAYGTTVIKDASELKVKESNRIQKTVQCLKILGANIEESSDGMIIHGPTKLHGAQISSFGDHRLALFLSIAGLICDQPVIITNAEVTDDSYPGFLESLLHLGAHGFIS
jgi:3-phosphoshikimate 1-carboxyvinyltransferase